MSKKFSILTILVLLFCFIGFASAMAEFGISADKLSLSPSTLIQNRAARRAREQIANREAQRRLDEKRKAKRVRAKAVYVKGYYKKNGTYVAPHYRKSPNSTVRDNFSYKGNVNPYTGKTGKNSYKNKNY